MAEDWGVGLSLWEVGQGLDSFVSIAVAFFPLFLSVNVIGLILHSSRGQYDAF